MEYSLSTDHITITPHDQELLDKKLAKLEKLVHQPYTMSIRFRHDTHHRTGEVVTCLINIGQGRRVFHAERSEDSIQTALDEVIDALKSELHKAHRK